MAAVYGEFPADEIVDVHFKKKDDGGGDGGGGGTHLCGEWGYDIPGDGFYVIYYDTPPVSACGEYEHAPAPLIPYPINSELIVPPRLITPRDGQVWTSSLPYYLSGDGIHFNPAMDPGLDCAMGRTPLMVPAVAFEITWEVEFGLLPAPFPGQMPCYGLAGRGIGLGMTNEIIDPAFNIYEPNMPATPNWGPAPIIYDAKSWGPGIVVTMGFADYSPNMCNDQIWVKGNCPEDVGCYDPQYYTNTHFKIKAMCPGAGSGGGGRTRLTRGRVPRNG